MPALQIFDNMIEMDLNSFKHNYKIAFHGDVKLSVIDTKFSKIVVQSLEHPIANIQVIDCDVFKQEELKMTIQKSTAYFEVINTPDIKILRDGKAIDEYSEPVCSLVNYSRGTYSFLLGKGRHNLVLAHVNALWLSAIVDKFPTFSDLFVANKENQFKRMRECPHRSEIRRTVHDFIYNGKDQPADNEPDFVASLNKIIARYHGNCESDQLTRALTLQHKAKRLVAFLDQHYAVPDLNIESIAKDLGMSNKSLQRLSKAIFGLGIREQIIKYRMTYAVRFLAVDKKSVKEVAGLTGYKSAAYFSRAFSKYWKMSPSAVRL